MAVATQGVLILCTGNVCRSPYIERRLAHELAGGAVSLASAGTHAVVGAPIDPRSAAELERNGGTREGFEARQATPEIIDGSDLVLCATREHRAAVVRMAPRALKKAFALTDFADLVSRVPSGPLPVGPFDDADSSLLTRLVRAAASERGSIQPRSDEAAAITDPIGQSSEVFARMADEVEAVLPPVIEALRRHVTSAS